MVQVPALDSPNRSPRRSHSCRACTWRIADFLSILEFAMHTSRDVLARDNRTLLRKLFQCESAVHFEAESSSASSDQPYKFATLIQTAPQQDQPGLEVVFDVR
jgi:hypothetical protein